jgi:hypothetical protein
VETTALAAHSSFLNDTPTRCAGQVEQLASELTDARAQAEHWQAQAGEYRAELAWVRSELTAAHTATDAEKAHAGQRLVDLQARYDDLVGELRGQVEALRATAVPAPAKARARTGRGTPTGRAAGEPDH